MARWRRDDDDREFHAPRAWWLQRGMDGAVGLAARLLVGTFRLLAGGVFRVLWGFPYRVVSGWWHVVRHGGERRRLVQLGLGAPALAGAVAAAVVAALVSFRSGDAIAERYQAAAEAAKKDANDDPKHPSWAVAKLLYSRLRVLASGVPAPTHDLAMLYDREGDHLSAQLLMRQLASGDAARGANAHVYLAKQLMARAEKTPLDWKNAREHLRRVLDANPDHPGANAWMGKIEAQLGNFAAAETNFLRALRAGDALKIEYAEFLSMFENRRGEADAYAKTAAQYYRQRCETNPADFDDRYGWIRAEALLRNYAEALRIAAAAPPAEAERWKAPAAQLLLQWGTRLPSGSAERWEKFAAASERVDAAPMTLAVALKAAFDSEPDAQAFVAWRTKLAARRPGEAGLIQGMFAAVRGPAAAAAAGFRAAQDGLGAKGPAVLRAVAQLGSFRHGTVLTFVDAAEPFWPKDRTLALLRARALVSDARYPEAQQALEELLVASPGDPTVNGLLAETYGRLGLKDKEDDCRKRAESGLSAE